MTALQADPPAGQVPAEGGIITHNLQNGGALRLVFKVKSTNNAHYRVRPVYGFVEPGAAAPLEITRLAGPPKDDKFVIQYAEALPDATDAQAAFSSTTPVGDVTIPISAQVTQVTQPAQPSQ